MHLDITELRTDQSKQYLFVAIDRMTKTIYIELHEHQTKDNAVLFLANLHKDCVFKISHILQIMDHNSPITFLLRIYNPRMETPILLMNYVKLWALNTERRSLDIHGLMDK